MRWDLRVHVYGDTGRLESLACGEVRVTAHKYSPCQSLVATTASL